LLFGRGTELDFAALAPGVIFKLASQGIADGNRVNFTRVALCRDDDEFAPRQTDRLRSPYSSYRRRE
jgi:hypothetical protein